MGHELLYLSRRDVLACAVSPAEMNAAIAAAFAAKAAGRAFAAPRLTLFRRDGSSFRAKAGSLEEPPYAALKWLGWFVGNEGRGLPNFCPLIVLSEAVTGLPVAVMDGTVITGWRTAAMTAVAAAHLARPDSRTVGFVACGLQARVNLAALRVGFPVERIVAWSRRRETAEAFAEEARASGLAAEVADDVRRAVAGPDIVVTSVPHRLVAAPFLDAGWLAPGSFVSMVDLGYSFEPTSIAGLDLVATDDRNELAASEDEQLNFTGAFAADLADLAGGLVAGRTDPAERIAFIFSGTGLADVAGAVLVYEKAVLAGIGARLPL